jgi:predicted transcriptional regulator
MGEVVMDFDDEPNEMTDVKHVLTLKSRAESIVCLPTKSNGVGVISKREIVPGVYLAEALTETVNGYCVTSVVNTSENDVIVEIPYVELEEVENNDSERALIFSTSVAEIGNRLSKLRDELRLDHLNTED